MTNALVSRVPSLSSRLAIAFVTTNCSVFFAHAQERGISGTAEAGVAGKRVALVIGNASYADAPLKNPVNDATDMAALLTAAGFAVQLKTDCDLRTMMDALDAFGQSIQGSDAALFFFAGHGVQVEGVNYLVPLNARLSASNEARFECLDANRVLAKMENAASGVNIVILDACRNNPLARSWRSADAGLAPMNAPSGSIMAFATAPGSVAADGTGRNGVFTGALLKHLATPGIDIEDAFKRVAADVQTTTAKAQIPWRSSNLTGDFYFLPSGGAVAVAPMQPGTAVAALPPPPSAMALVGGLQVSVNAPGAVVKVDGREVGTASPNEALNVKDLPAGRVTVEVAAANYESVSKQVDIKTGEWTQMPIELAKVMTAALPPGRDGPAAGEEREFAGMRFVWIPPGTFTMGSPVNEPGRDDDEAQHQVTLARGYWLGKFEVTQAEWQALMGSNPSEFNGNGPPVEMASWEDCQAFIQRLNQKGEGRFRLPTEAEWEYACRAGTATAFSFGSNPATLWQHGNYCDQAISDGISWQDTLHNDGHDKSAPVGSFGPNAWGLHDMHGNVYEWCLDWYGAYPAGSVTDPQGPNSGQQRVLRGGSWRRNPAGCRASARTYAYTGPRFTGRGFRLLRTQD